VIRDDPMMLKSTLKVG